MNSKNMYKNYSTIITVYNKDKFEYFQECIRSVLNQTLKSNDIIIVKDGEVQKDIEEYLTSLTKKHKEIRIIELPVNKGTSKAMNEGLKIAKNELIARVDADDINCLDRTEKQVREFNKDKELVVLGGQITEFVNTKDNIKGKREVPTSEVEIKKFSKRRNPINQPTAMFRKSKIQAIGGYNENMRRIQDYDLWIRSIQEGYKLKNLDDTLVFYRLDKSAIQRRKTFSQTKQFIKFRYKLLKIGYSSLLDFLAVSILQLILFLVPNKIANALFKTLRTK